jgi:TolB-like protein/tetratricopeptide (TPR) repeat protein
MSLSTGTRLGPYEIVGALGAGGMGEVYRARDTRLARDVAVKVVSASLDADPVAGARFRREALAVASVSHPNVLALYDVGSDGGVSFVVTEMLQGATLREELSSGPLPLGSALDAARQVARGLAAIHERGIIHRDLKPENILRTTDGHLKILDFGLARFGPSPSEESETATMVTGVTTAGSIIGTRGYMAPEQLLAKPVDHRADLFAFGAVLFEMVTGRRAFPGLTWSEVNAAILKDEPPSMADSGRHVPAALEAIVRRCLQKDPASRLASASELIEALAGVDVTGPAGRVAPRRALSGAALIGVVAAVMLLGIAGVLTYRATREQPDSVGAVATRPGALAMFPFRNLTGDAAWDWIGQGLPELLGTALARSPELDVYDPQRLNDILDADADTPEVTAATLAKLHRQGVNRAIVGSLLRSGNTISIQCRIIDVRDGRVVHADALQGGEGSDIFQLAGTLIPKLQTWLEIDLAGSEAGDQFLRELTTSSPEAYRLYLRAHDALIGSRWREAADFAGQAIALDSSFVSAHVDMVGATWNLNDVPRMGRHLAILRRERNRASTRDRVQIDLIDAVVSRDPPRLIAAGLAAHEMFPENKFFQYLLGRGYYTAQRWAECVQILAPLVEQRWTWSWTYILSALSHAKLGQAEQARRTWEIGMEVTHDDPEVAWAYSEFLRDTGDLPGSRRIVFAAAGSPKLAQSPDAEADLSLSMARFFVEEGKPDSARAMYARAVALLPPEDERSVRVRRELEGAAEGPR